MQLEVYHDLIIFFRQFPGQLDGWGSWLNLFIQSNADTVKATLFSEFLSYCITCLKLPLKNRQNKGH